MSQKPPPPIDEPTDAESDMSFPASDPPSRSQPTLGDGVEPRPDEPEEPERLRDEDTADGP